MISHYSIKYKGEKLPQTFIWAGIYYEREPAEIWIGAENVESQAMEFCQKVDQIRRTHKFDDFDFVSEDNCYWFKMPKDETERLFNEKSYDKQCEILKSFFLKIILLPMNY